MNRGLTSNGGYAIHSGMSRQPNRPEAIWKQVTNYGDPDKCWEWKGYVGTSGYGRITINYKDELVHRIAFQLSRGDVPFGLFVCHECDNKICCNPNHLWLGTAVDNNLDCVSKGRKVCGDQHWTRVYPEKVARGNKNGARLHPEKLSRGDQHWTRLYPDLVARGKRSGQHTHPERTARGERNGNAKLTKDQIFEIFAYHKLGWSQKQLAEHFGVLQANISRILRGVLWKPITQPLLALIKAGKL